MKALLALSRVLLTMAFATTALAPYSFYTLPVNSLVMLENLVEDPMDDAATLTPLEATADMFALPVTMAMNTLRLAAYLTVGVVMVLAGKESKTTIDQINWVLPLPLTGPNPDLVGYHSGMILKKGCLLVS